MNSAYAYKTDAESAANAIKSYVIPEEATYSKDDLDSNHNSLLTALTATQAQVSTIANFLPELADYKLRNVDSKYIKEKIADEFDNLLGVVGYQKLFGGLILQWGSGMFDNESDDVGSIVTVTINLPKKVNRILNAQISMIYPDDGAESTEHTCAISPISTTQLQARFERVLGSNSGGEKGYFSWFIIAI